MSGAPILVGLKAFHKTKKHIRKKKGGDEVEGGDEGEGEEGVIPEDKQKVIHLKPSVELTKYITHKAKPRKSGPKIKPEPPFMYRVYKNTLKKNTLDIFTLRTSACFILVCDEDRRVVLWIGAEASEEDEALANESAVDVVLIDHAKSGAQDCSTIYEQEEESDEDVFRYFLSKFSATGMTDGEHHHLVDKNVYWSKKAKSDRLKLVHNIPSDVGVIGKLSNGRMGVLERIFIEPDENGSLQPSPFPEILPNTIVFVNMDTEWELWIARGVTPSDETKAKEFLSTIISNWIERKMSGGSRKVPVVNVHVIRQGCERSLFRAMFEVSSSL